MVRNLIRAHAKGRLARSTEQARPCVRNNRRALKLLLLTSTLAGGLLVFACSDDETTTPPATSPDGSISTSDSSTTPPSTADSSTTPTDAGDDGGELITDGGGVLPEEDGGDPDAGFDAGPACQTLTPGAFVDTACASRVAILQGGDLVTATYDLVSVTVLGSVSFCGVGGGYIPYEHRGALRVTATSAKNATFEFLDQYRKKQNIVVRPTSVRYDVTAASAAATLTFTELPCKSKAPPTTATYSVSAVNGKKAIVLRLPYGTGFALYRYHVDPSAAW